MQEATLRDAEEIERYFLNTTGMKPGYQQLARGPVNLTVRTAELDGVSIIWTRGGGRARWRDEMSGDGLHLGFAIECDGEIRSRGKALKRNQGQLWMPDKEMDLILGGSNLTLDIGVSIERVDELGWQFAGDPIAEVPQPALSNLIQTCVLATKAVGAASATNQPPDAAPKGEALLQCLEPVLTPWMSGSDAAAGTARSQSYRILESADAFFERMQPGQKLNIDDLATSLGISRRTVFHTFRTQYGIGPRRYLELKRLYWLRSSLRHADPQAASVSRLAGDLGFDDLGRMARRYQELFNEFPSETLRRTH